MSKYNTRIVLKSGKVLKLRCTEFSWKKNGTDYEWTIKGGTPHINHLDLNEVAAIYTTTRWYQNLFNWL